MRSICCKTKIFKEI